MTTGPSGCQDEITHFAINRSAGYPQLFQLLREPSMRDSATQLRNSVRKPLGLVFPVLSFFLLLALCSWWYLGLSISQFFPDLNYSSIAKEFLSRALSPAVEFEGEYRGTGWDTVPWKAAKAALFTVQFAGFALTLSIVIGGVLGVLSSQYFCRALAGPQASEQARWKTSNGIVIVSRTVAVALRSIHELIWAVLFLAALGLSNLTAALAIALPYGGILAKVFSEMIDESPRAGGEAILESGGSGLQAVLFGIFPICWPDIAAYLLYRFECAVRSSAVLGFFGLPTLGYYISASFENLYYGEVWTYLYALVFVVALLDLLGRNLRRGIDCAAPRLD